MNLTAVLFWLALGALEALQTFVRMRMAGASLHDAIQTAVIGPGAAYAALAIMTPVVLSLGRRFPLEHPRFLRHFAIHTGAALLFPVCHQVLTALAVPLMGATEMPGITLPTLLARWIVAYFTIDVLRYWAIVALYHVARYRERSLTRELEAHQYRAQAHALQASLVQARLETLTQQLQPHFLFNALNAISGFVLREEPERAATLLSHLADLLRVSLRKSEPEVPLSSELDVVRSYLALECARFGPQLTITWEIQDQALDKRLPAFVLQTIVENAIRHGVGSVSGIGHVRIAAAVVKDHLVLEVADSGAGFQLDADGLPAADGIGLPNTRQRLAQLYGAHASMTFENPAQGGAMVRLSVPITSVVPHRPVTAIVPEPSLTARFPI
ncbi:MAG: histidine kinase [Gemmatimonadaceae bacterium]